MRSRSPLGAVAGLRGGRSRRVGPDQFGGLRVDDVMTPDPVTAVPSAWLAAFVEHTVLCRPFSTYPLVDLDGRFTGLVTLNDIRAVPADRRWWTRLGDIATPAGEAVTAAPGEPLSALAARIDARDPACRGRVVVLDGHRRVVGVITPSDLARATLRAELGTAPGTPRRRPPARTSEPPAGAGDRLLPA